MRHRPARQNAGSTTPGRNFVSVAAASAMPSGTWRPRAASSSASATKPAAAASIWPLPANSQTGSGSQA